MKVFFVFLAVMALTGCGDRFKEYDMRGSYTSELLPDSADGRWKGG